VVAARLGDVSPGPLGCCTVTCHRHASLASTHPTQPLPRYPHRRLGPRYATVDFSDQANLDEGDLWQAAYAVTA